ncbi:SRPBCC family protein [Azospirillum halopraeferens]|uniref:SRPBCC family protein n=1 Tax=Azospirillum halopraeferens TaxID=34010 RepID=UPI000412B9AF|nr:SRPBCC family protein [Azospirillum halopraeferens]
MTFTQNAARDRTAARESRRDQPQGGGALTPALGWFSLGLGLAQVAAPEAMTRLVGAGGGRREAQTMRAVGLREIATGIGILTQDRPAGWMWTRVGGDVMDLAILAGASSSRGARPERLAMAGAAVLGVLALDWLSARQESAAHDGHPAAREDGPVHARGAVTINRPREEVYRFWRQLDTLPRFMSHLEAVEPVDATRSRWRARGPMNTTYAWEAEITEDRPNERLAWRSLPGADVDNAGEVRFERATGGRGTVVRVDLRYTPPYGRAGMALAYLFGREPGAEMRDDLRALKQILETGEVTMSDAMLGRVRHPAQPDPRPVPHTSDHGRPV